MTIMKESLHLTCTEQNSGGIFCYPTTSQQARIFYVENAAYGWNWGGGGVCHASVSLSKPCGTVLGSHLNESLNG